ncbi:MAG: TIGR03905 family TSCPD domain-containing protein [Firmicutes bacterium]|nr:TIGR03905 family TSCPD domain-containing protein [Bacillota bacterium]
MGVSFKPTGICAREINFDVRDGKVRDVEFVGGCDGNQTGIESLVDGMDIDDVIKKLRGIKCGQKCSSCPDQLAEALEKFKASGN